MYAFCPYFTNEYYPSHLKINEFHQHREERAAGRAAERHQLPLFRALPVPRPPGPGRLRHRCSCHQQNDLREHGRKGMLKIISHVCTRSSRRATLARSKSTKSRASQRCSTHLTTSISSSSRRQDYRCSICSCMRARTNFTSQWNTSAGARSRTSSSITPSPVPCCPPLSSKAPDSRTSTAAGSSKACSRPLPIFTVSTSPTATSSLVYFTCANLRT